MSKIIWTNGKPMFPLVSSLGSMDNDVASYIGELEASLEQHANRLNSVRACAAHIEHTPVDLGAMKAPKITPIKPNAHPQENEVTDLLFRLECAGCQLISVDDGGDEYEITKTVGEACEAVCSVGDSWVKMRMPDGMVRDIYLVLGNDPGVVVNDYGDHPVLDRVTSEHNEYWEEK